MDKFVIYTRVSTRQQGDSGLGLEAQMKTCSDYVKSVGGKVDECFQDIESGTHRNRKGLLNAVDYCKANNATLVIAKLDRLARDIEFTFKVVNTGIKIYFCDMPSINTLTLGIFATVAQYERELISQRTKAALSAKKEQGYKLGRPKGCDISSACKRASELRTERAKENQNNKMVWALTKDCKTRADFIKAADTLNSMGVKTQSGLEFNYTRIYGLYRRIKNRMEQ